MFRVIAELHLSYWCSFWGCCSKSKTDILRKIHNRAARIETNNPYDASATPVIQSLGRSTINNLVRKETAMLTYKSLNSLAPGYLGKLFLKCSYNRERLLHLSETDLKIQLLKTSSCKKKICTRSRFYYCQEMVIWK